MIMLWDLGLVFVRHYFHKRAWPFVYQTVYRAELAEQTHSHTFVDWEKSVEMTSLVHIDCTQELVHHCLFCFRFLSPSLALRPLITSL